MIKKCRGSKDIKVGYDLAKRKLIEFDFSL
jgi:hypothetical protein